MEPRDPIRVEDPGAVDALLRSTELSKPEVSKPEVSQALDRPALGRDPFADRADFDPFAEGLAELGIEAKHVAREPAPHAPESTRHASEPAAPEPTPLGRSRRRCSSTPRLAEIEPPDPSGLLERWLGPEERRRLAALEHLVENEASYDRFGMSPEVLRRSFPFFYALYRLYFRVQSRGHENVPVRGPVILASNHGGLLPFDGAMLVTDLLLNTDPPRLARCIVDRWAGSLHLL